MVRVRYLGLLLIASLAGCAESSYYPDDLRYPLRRDVLVVEKPPAQSLRRLHSPGHLDANIIEGIEQYGGKAYDPVTGKTIDSQGGKATSSETYASDRKELAKALENVFGTPASPTVAVASDAVEALALDERTLRQGSKHYRRHCLHCHGLTGDGRGPTGPWVNPHPRDYRRGIFKFISTSTDLGGFRPSRRDLMRTISKGIESTSMPAFELLPETERQEIVSYVIHLSLRGEAEYETVKTLLENRSNLKDGSVEATVLEQTGALLGYWADASKSENVQKTPDYKVADDKTALQESIRRGYSLFTNPEGAASCIACHLDFGRQVPYRFDDWGTLVRPANLTLGMYRGGRRPIDLYWRISRGIGPSGMPSAKLSDQDYWDLVNFVQNLPYPAMLPPDVKNKIYGSADKKPTVAHASTGR
jgi:mono/diheme cytochrome c family protein